MRDELRAAVRGLLEHLPGQPYDKSRSPGADHRAGKYVALARSPVDRDSQGEIRLVLDPEAPTRIVKMLAQFWRASRAAGLDKGDAWALVRRVGMDSIPKLRRAILDYLANPRWRRPRQPLPKPWNIPSRRRVARWRIWPLIVVVRLAGGPGKADRWELADQTRRWLDAMTFPVSSDPPIETEITREDKTGKVKGKPNGKVDRERL